MSLILQILKDLEYRVARLEDDYEGNLSRTTRRLIGDLEDSEDLESQESTDESI